jgi:hypothetical protein
MSLRDRDDLAAIAAADELADHYQAGRDNLARESSEKAIWHLEQVARALPDNFLANLYTAQAMVAWMQQSGWDVGYSARARRYLRKAGRLRQDDPRVRQLQRQLDAIDDSHQEETSPS